MKEVVICNHCGQVSPVDWTHCGDGSYGCGAPLPAGYPWEESDLRWENRRNLLTTTDYVPDDWLA
jgi:hypothetical protein